MRYQPLCGIEFLLQALHVVQVIGAGFGIFRARILGGSACKVSALRRVRTGVGAKRNAIFIDIQIPPEVRAGVQHVARHDFATVVGARFVPRERRGEALIHADIEIGHHKDWRLQPISKIQGRRGMLETLMRIFGKQQDVFGVAMRRVGAGEHVGLLRSRGHSGGGSAALDIDDRDGDFGEVGEPEELGHQRNARAGSRGERARAIPARADHDADGGNFIFGLHDRVAILPGLGIDAILPAIFLESFRQRGRGRDRIPRTHRRATVNTAQSGCGVAVDENLVANIVGAAHS